MSGLQPRVDEQINGVDVREQGSALRVATNSPHLVSLGTGRFSTAVTLHPIKQGPMTIGSDPSSDIRVTGEGVQPLHCRVEASHGVFTLYPAGGDTRLDAAALAAPARLSQGCMITLGRSTYLRFNNPAEASLMKSVLPTANEDAQTGYAKNNETNKQSYQTQNNRNLNELNNLEQEINMTLKENGRKKPPAVPKKPNREDYEESLMPKMTSIMAKVSKFEYYARTQQKTVGKSQFYTNENEISPKVFSSNSLTCNTPAKDVLGKIPSNLKNNRDQKVLVLPENNVMDQKSCYANVALRNRTKIDDIVRNFDENRPQLPKKVNNTEHLYGKINTSSRSECVRPSLPSPAYDRNPQYCPVYSLTHTSQYERSYESENRRIQAYQDRVKEEQQKEVENARLEEILSMCAEYERQASAGTPVTPTEKRAHNKIITNGSLPRSVALNNPNFVQTSEGYYKFDTSHNRASSQMSQSLPIQRHVSSYENYDVTQIQNGAQNGDAIDIKQNGGRMDEIGIPVYEENKLASPILIRKVCETNSPVGSPYENVYYRNMKPKSPNTQSPRTRIKTSFAHKNLPSPQYFVFPTPPPVENSKKPTFVIPEKASEPKFGGIEKQLSLEEEIPMIDDINVSDDIEYRYSKVDINAEENNTLVKNQSFDDVKKELMADIPELDEFEKDLKQNRDKIANNVKDITPEVEVKTELEIKVVDDVTELRSKYDELKAGRKKLLAEIHEYKSKMTEIRSQEDDILRELEMEKALIKGEYDSEIAILNIEQKKKIDLLERAKRIEDEVKELKSRQEGRQKEMADRVEIATLKVERIAKDIKHGSATHEELQNAQDILDNETKISEDLEFQHLEEESELLSNREDLQNEIALLTKKIDAQKTRILSLKSEANNNLTSALDETKVLQAEYVKMLNEVEVITTKVQAIEKELKPIVVKLNDIERTQSPDSAFYTDQTRAKSGEFGYSPQTSDSDDLDTKVGNYENHTQLLKDKFSSIDQMSQSMIVDIERRDITEIVDSRGSESPSKSSTSSKEKKGFWERNFDSLSRRKKKPKCPEKVDIMSQSLNENIFYNNDNIENETPFDKFGSLRNSKNKKDKNGPLKSNSSSKIPTFAALGKIIKKESFGKKKESDLDEVKNNVKNRYVKNAKTPTDNKYVKAKTPDKILEENAEPNHENDYPKVLHRKSCGDEPNSREFNKISDTSKIPSQDDIDRISKVTLDAPILTSDTDMNSLGKKAVNSLKEIERKRLVMLEEQGCQVIENERDRISELKRRVQDETKKMWDQKYKSEHTKSFDSDTCNSMVSDFDSLQNSLTEPYRMSERTERSQLDSLDVTSSTAFDESSGLMSSSSIEELQVRNSRTESVDEEKRSDESRPLSNASDFSRENILSLNGAPRRSRRTIAPYGESQRPLTRYLPVGDRRDFDLRRHVESAGHQVELCPHVTINVSSCRGHLHKLGAKFHTWSKRWFVFDRDTKTFVYYWDKSERKPRGGAYFQVIEEVYIDHGNTSRSPSPHTTFIVKTRQRRYYLMAPSGEAARIWIDVIFTGAQGYTEYLE